MRSIHWMLLIPYGTWAYTCRCSGSIDDSRTRHWLAQGWLSAIMANQFPIYHVPKLNWQEVKSVVFVHLSYNVSISLKVTNTGGSIFSGERGSHVRIYHSDYMPGGWKSNLILVCLSSWPLARILWSQFGVGVEGGSQCVTNRCSN